MLHLNETINTLLNQLVDAGQLANLQGGYIDSRLKPLQSGESLHDPGEWKKIKANAGINIKEGIFPIQYKEPSTVLYQLLGLLIQTAKDLSSSTEVMTGAAGTENAKTGAVAALIQEGMKVFTSIQKRVYRSLTSEFRKVFRLNKIYLDPSVYIEVLDDDLSVKQQDFDEKNVNIIPVADPNLASDAQRAAKTQLLLAAQALPGIDPIKITKRILLNSNIDHPEELLISDEEIQKQKQAPNPDAVKIQADIEAKAQELNIKGRELSLEEKKFALEALKTQSEIILNRANALKAVAQADQAQATTQLNTYDLQLRAIQTQLDHLLNLSDLNLQDMQYRDAQNEQTPPGPMAGTSPE